MYKNTTTITAAATAIATASATVTVASTGFDKMQDVVYSVVCAVEY
jgi:hypothetical protein